MKVFKDFNSKKAVKDPDKITSFILSFLPKYIVVEDDIEFTFKKWRGVIYIVNEKDKRPFNKRIAEAGWSFNRETFMYELKENNKVVFEITAELIDATASPPALFYHIYRHLGYPPLACEKIIKNMLGDRV